MTHQDPNPEVETPSIDPDAIKRPPEDFPGDGDTDPSKAAREDEQGDLLTDHDFGLTSEGDEDIDDEPN